jgi:hypothetical protein
MATIWVWRTSLVANADPTAGQDVTGFAVESRDGEHVGTVDEATYDNDEGALVVDTGFWIFGKKRMVPVGLVERVDGDDRKLVLAAPKDVIKDAPDYDEVRRADREYRDRVADHYARMTGDPIAPVAGVRHEPPR